MQNTSIRIRLRAYDHRALDRSTIDIVDTYDGFTSENLAKYDVLLFNNRTEEAIEVLESAISRSESAGHLNTYISPCYAWLGTALRTQVEQTESRDGRRLALRMIKARKATEKATRIKRSLFFVSASAV